MEAMRDSDKRLGTPFAGRRYYEDEKRKVWFGRMRGSTVTYGDAFVKIEGIVEGY
jgi:hypothetical protein